MNTGNVNNVNSVNNNLPIKKKEQTEKKKDTEFQHEIDYLNTPNPAEMLGRSMVQKKSIPQPADIEDTTSFKLSPITLTKSRKISKEEAVEVLKFFNFSDKELELIDFEDKDIMQSLANTKAYIESGVFKKDELDEIKENFNNASLEDKIRFAKELSGKEYYDYLTKETFESLSPYFEITADNSMDLVEKLFSLENRDLFFEKIPLIVDFSGKIEDFKHLGLSSVEEITKEKTDILKKINSHLDNNNKLSVFQCGNLGKIEDLTPDVISRYTELLDNLKGLKGFKTESLLPSYQNLDIKTLKEQMEKVDEFLKEYPLNLEDDQNSNVADLDDLAEFAERKDKQEIQEYINSLSPEAKSIGIRHMPAGDSVLTKEKMADICEILSDKDFDRYPHEKVFNFIDKQAENNYADIDYIIKLIKRSKGTTAIQNTCITLQRLTILLTALKCKKSLKKNSITTKASPNIILQVQ